MGIKSAISRFSGDTPAYGFLRDTYQRVFNRTYWKKRQRVKAFFSNFIAHGDLVFDVGANVGEYTRTFLTLGARVVAVEPNPQLIATLKQIRPFDRVRVEVAAVGSSNGSSELFLCDHNVLSTLSHDWIEIAETSERFSGIKWNQKVAVAVVTLDELIKKYGSPSFIKIDVEGYESDALAGLSKAPPHLSFEVNTEFPNAAIDCLRQRCFTADSRFNLTFGQDGHFVFANWVSGTEMIQFLGSAEFLNRKTYGDIVVRTPRT